MRRNRKLLALRAAQSIFRGGQLIRAPSPSSTDRHRDRHCPVNVMPSPSSLPSLSFNYVSLSFFLSRNRIMLTSSLSDVAAAVGRVSEAGIWAIQTPAFHFALLDRTLFVGPPPSSSSGGLFPIASV